MIKNHWNRFLLAAATEHENAGGGAGAAAKVNAAADSQAGETSAQEEDKAPPEEGGERKEPGASAEKREPTRLEMIAASVKDKGSLLAENKDLKAELETSKGTITAHVATIAGLRAELETAKGQIAAKDQELAAIDHALTTAKAEKKTVDEAAANQLASQGFESKDLPAAEVEEESEDALVARMNATTNEKEKFDLAARINKKRGVVI